jgi:hypothetical protein
VSDDDLKALARELFADGPAVGSRWRHYRGSRYEVVALSLNEFDLEPLVTYRGLDTGLTWTRTLENWSATVRSSSGQDVPRFSPLGSGDAPCVTTGTSP